MSHINYSFNQTDDSLPRDKMKLRNIASTRYSGDWPSIPHSHSYAELFYIVDGAGQFQINDKLFPVQAHQLVVVNPNVIHTEVSLESHPLEYIVLGIEGLEFTISDAAEGSFCVYTFDGNNDVLPCMRKILTEMQNRESNFQILCQAYMDIIVVQLMRNASVSAVPIHSRLPANRQCATVKRYIDHHYKENLTLDELAEKVSISKYHMAHAFKREYGVSPINYIIDCRIREGKRLLAETDLAPSQIASMPCCTSVCAYSSGDSCRCSAVRSPCALARISVLRTSCLRFALIPGIVNYHIIQLARIFRVAQFYGFVHIRRKGAVEQVIRCTGFVIVSIPKIIGKPCQLGCAVGLPSCGQRFRLDFVLFKIETSVNVIPKCGYCCQDVNQCAVVAVHCLAAVEVG